MAEPARPVETGDVSRWPRRTASLHESLASQEAQAAELRQELDELRRSLDTPAPAKPVGQHRAPHGSRRRRLVLPVLAVLLVVGVAVLVTLTRVRGGASVAAPRTTAGAPAPGSSPAASGAAPASPSASASPSVAQTPAPAAAPLPDWPGRSVPQPAGLPAGGPGADAPGTEVTAAIAADRRHVDVYQRMLLPGGASSLTLGQATLPSVRRALDAAPDVTDLHAAVDGTPVAATRTATGWALAVPAGTPGTRLELRYRLDGALVRRAPAPPGRYTLVVTPLTPLPAPGRAPSLVRLDDDRVAEVYCAGAPDELCGAVQGSLHTAAVPAGVVPVVVALVTMP